MLQPKRPAPPIVKLLPLGETVPPDQFNAAVVYRIAGYLEQPAPESVVTVSTHQPVDKIEYVRASPAPNEPISCGDGLKKFAKDLIRSRGKNEVVDGGVFLYSPEALEQRKRVVKAIHKKQETKPTHNYSKKFLCFVFDFAVDENMNSDQYINHNVLKLMGERADMQDQGHFRFVLDPMFDNNERTSITRDGKAMAPDESKQTTDTDVPTLEQEIDTALEEIDTALEEEPGSAAYWDGKVENANAPHSAVPSKSQEGEQSTADLFPVTSIVKTHMSKTNIGLSASVGSEECGTVLDPESQTSCLFSTKSKQSHKKKRKKKKQVNIHDNDTVSELGSVASSAVSMVSSSTSVSEQAGQSSASLEQSSTGVDKTSTNKRNRKENDGTNLLGEAAVGEEENSTVSMTGIVREEKRMAKIHTASFCGMQGEFDNENEVGDTVSEMKSMAGRSGVSSTNSTSQRKRGQQNKKENSDHYNDTMSALVSMTSATVVPKNSCKSKKKKHKNKESRYSDDTMTDASSTKFGSKSNTSTISKQNRKSQDSKKLTKKKSKKDESVSALKTADHSSALSVRSRSKQKKKCWPKMNETSDNDNENEAVSENADSSMGAVKTEAESTIPDKSRIHRNSGNVKKKKKSKR